jgi:hypothetical protein
MAEPSTPHLNLIRASGALNKLWPWHSTKNSSFYRLANIIPSYKVHLEDLIRRCENQQKGNFLSPQGNVPDCQTQPPVDSDNSWITSAREYLSEAEQALQENKPELGWLCFNAATRMELHGWHQLDKAMFHMMTLAILGRVQLSCG